MLHACICGMSEPLCQVLKDTMKAHARAAVSRSKNLMTENTNIHHGYERWIFESAHCAGGHPGGQEVQVQVQLRVAMRKWCYARAKLVCRSAVRCCSRSSLISALPLLLLAVILATIEAEVIIVKSPHFSLQA